VAVAILKISNIDILAATAPATATYRK